jgi:hypothetical protein
MVAYWNSIRERSETLLQREVINLFYLDNKEGGPGLGNVDMMKYYDL